MSLAMRPEGVEIDISIVIPAFNEEKRLAAFLPYVISFCNKAARSYEIIIVDDGSTDQTAAVAKSFKAAYANLSVISNRINRGKGVAVRRGMQSAKGDVCVFFDSDGSVLPEEIEKNIHYILQDGYDIFVGSRVMRGEGQRLKVRWHRKLIGSVFNYFVRTLLFRDISDTQCGFKMFRHSVVEPLFSRSHIHDFGFDVEILYLAHKMGYRVKEGPVSWQHVHGSKVNLFTDSMKMLFNIVQVRNWHYTPINFTDKHLGPDECNYMYKMERRHWWFVSRTSLIASLIRSCRIPSPKILDVGAGTGGNMLAFEKMGKIYGVDISEMAVEHCVRQGIKNIVRGLAEFLPFKDKTFDIITCLDVLEHIPEPIGFLVELGRVLKEDGRIIIIVPAYNLLWSQHDEALCHLRRYEKKALFAELSEARLRVDKASYFFFTSFFVVAPIRLLRRFFYEKRCHSDTTTLPPQPINEILKHVFRLEERIAMRCGLPFGSSLYAVANKE